MQQRDEEWFKARAGKFTGSRFSDLMAKTKSGPAASRANLIATLAVERLTGQCVETYTNAAMARGTELEPEARAAYEVTTGVMVEEVAWVAHPELEYVGVSPDGLLPPLGLVEFKVPSAMAKHLDALRTGAHAVEYKWQLQGQLWVTERDWVDAVSYDPRWPEPLQLAITRVHRDEAAISALRAECIAAHAEVEALVRELQQRVAA
jgi:hypothetical protein